MLILILNLNVQEIYNIFMFCTSLSDAPFTKLSIAERIISLFFIFVSQIEISQ